MLTSSAKAKGRKLQQFFRDVLREIGSNFGLKAGDIESRGMGQSGTDIILSPAAINVFGDLAIECKNKETLNVVTTFWEHAAKYPKSVPFLVHKKNNTTPLVTLRVEDFDKLMHSAYTKGFIAG